MKDIVYIIGIVLGVGFAFKVGKIEGIQSVPVPVPLEVNIEKQCVAWFFNTDLKAAKKHMCSNRK